MQLQEPSDQFFTSNVLALSSGWGCNSPFEMVLASLPKGNGSASKLTIHFVRVSLFIRTTSLLVRHIQDYFKGKIFFRNSNTLQSHTVKSTIAQDTLYGPCREMEGEAMLQDSRSSSFRDILSDLTSGHFVEYPISSYIALTSFCFSPRFPAPNLSMKRLLAIPRGISFSTP